jgi:hypothetical protein
VGRATRLLVLAFLLGAGCSSRTVRRPPSPRPAFTSLLLRPEGAERRVRNFEQALSRGDWPRALDIAEQIIRDNTLVPIEPGSETTAATYVRPASYLIATIAGASRDFLRAYRERFDAEALLLVGTQLSLENWERYFFCTGMDRAGDALANTLLDDGRALPAMNVWRSICEHYPDPTIPRHVLAARLMGAAHAAGDLETLLRASGHSGMILAGSSECTLDQLRQRLAGQMSEAAPRLIRRTMKPALRGIPIGASRVCALAAWREIADGVAIEDRYQDGAWSAALQWRDREVILFRTGAAAEWWGPHAGGGAILNIPLLVTFLRPAFTFILDEMRVVWQFGDVAGVVELDPFRLTWVGPVARAPIPARWREALDRDALALHDKGRLEISIELP